ncbi:helix-turn-helix domain-containing protein [Actinocatenispora comari]|uniref:helix-turn-helix domain-containing protein n=1 Tax=Actinocatenispora comari TaxID=2807577 RepID=UPI001CECDCA6|nr:helix-turn-helix transcriptional regulator [Actinocatenispora comari]
MTTARIGRSYFQPLPPQDWQVPREALDSVIAATYGHCAGTTRNTFPGSLPDSLAGRWSVPDAPDTLTIGERIAWKRRRRGMSQGVLAGLVGRTEDWLSKVENNKIHLDRLSVLRSLADCLDVSVGDLLGEPTMMQWSPDSGTRTVPALREALLDYRQLSPFLSTAEDEPVALPVLKSSVDDLWTAYQESQFGYVVNRLPAVLSDAQTAVRNSTGDDRDQARQALALTYQAAATLLTKLGETDLAWISAERGFHLAQDAGNPVVLGSLFRSLTHTLLATGRYADAVRLVEDAANFLEPGLSKATPTYLSVYGTLFLTGSVAASRSDNRAAAQTFLTEADSAARRIGQDANHLWTAFGPTNVAIHRVQAALELGDVQVAMDLAPGVDTSSLPAERRARHAIETARAYNAWNRTDDAMAALLNAEQFAPEQIRYHAASRNLVRTWVRRSRGTPSHQLTGLARRMQVAE